MKSFDDVLAAAKAAPRPFQDVTVSLDDDVAKRRAELHDELAAARANPDARLASKSKPELIQGQLDELMELTANQLVTLRFSRLPGNVWADIAARCPARIDAPVDRHFGYNMQAAAMIAAPLCGVRVDGDELVPLRVEAATTDTPAVNQWADLFATIAGTEATQIESAIFDLNVYEPQQRVGQLKKELATRPA